MGHNDELATIFTTEENMTTARVEYIARVNLPSSGGFAMCPSGDSDYEIAYDVAIKNATPDGFEADIKTQHLWPKDRDGMTWIRLVCTDESKAIEALSKQVQELTRQLERMKEIGRQLAGG